MGKRQGKGNDFQSSLQCTGSVGVLTFGFISPVKFCYYVGWGYELGFDFQCVPTRQDLYMYQSTKIEKLLSLLFSAGGRAMVTND